MQPTLKHSCTLKKQCKGHFSGCRGPAGGWQLLGSLASPISGAGRRGRSNVFEFSVMWGVAGLLLPSLRQLSGDRSRAQSSLLTPMVTAATSVLRAEMEHSCSERVKDEKAPATASPGLSARILELLPQSSKGGQGQGMGGARKPWAHELGQGGLRAILFPQWEQAGQRGESLFPVLAFTLYYCCFQQTCLVGGAVGGLQTMAAHIFQLSDA